MCTAVLVSQWFYWFYWFCQQGLQRLFGCCVELPCCFCFHTLCYIYLYEKCSTNEVSSYRYELISQLVKQLLWWQINTLAFRVRSAYCQIRFSRSWLILVIFLKNIGERIWTYFTYFTKELIKKKKTTEENGWMDGWTYPTWHMVLRITFWYWEDIISVQTLACENMKVARQAKKKSMALGIIKKHI